MPRRLSGHDLAAKGLPKGRVYAEILGALEQAQWHSQEVEAWLLERYGHLLPQGD